jgi:gluconokinase
LLDGRPAAVMAFLMVSREELDRRLLARTGHFFPEKLLDSQLATLEPPQPDERVVTVQAENSPVRTAANVAAVLSLKVDQ